MTLAIIILIFSICGVSITLFNKVRELDTGKAIISISKDTDQKIVDLYTKIYLYIKELPKRIFHSGVILVLRLFYVFSSKLKKKIYPKISHLVDTVKGRDLPKNKGSVSFFLERVKEHSDGLKKEL